jgi:predicted nucleic acid-binding protein
MAFLSSANAGELYLSVLTLGELRKGAAVKRMNDAASADQRDDWVNKIERDFADRVVPVDAAIARRWGEVSAPHSLPVVDTLIGATAAMRGLTLVTRNGKDFSATGAGIINPWAFIP